MEEVTEVRVLRDGGLRVRHVSARAVVGHVLFDFDFAEHLHADHGVDEEEHDDQEADVGQRLERFDERPEQRLDALLLAEQLHQAHHAEQAEEVHREAHLRRGVYLRGVVRLHRTNTSRIE